MKQGRRARIPPLRWSASGRFRQREFDSHLSLVVDSLPESRLTLSLLLPGIPTPKPASPKLDENDRAILSNRLSLSRLGIGNFVGDSVLKDM